jgi:DNA processing protein
MIDRCERLQLVPGGPSWPIGLERIEGPPGALWARGRLSALKVVPRVAIVGTRAPTPYGQAQAERFAHAFAVAGIAVVSGLARGIDQCSHRAALEAGGPTIAVLGSGVAQPWPTGPVTDRMILEGLLLSEFAPEQGPRPYHFPLRNRLISGLCEAVIVIEAATASGSLITARWAVDQGRAVFALPGRVDHPMARGTHSLIREGATLVESPDDVLRELGVLEPARHGNAQRRSTPEDEPILDALRGETLGAEELGDRLERSPQSVLVDLVRLELEGHVHRCPGGLYRLAR